MGARPGGGWGCRRCRRGCGVALCWGDGVSQGWVRHAGAGRWPMAGAWLSRVVALAVEGELAGLGGVQIQHLGFGGPPGGDDVPAPRVFGLSWGWPDVGGEDPPGLLAVAGHGDRGEVFAAVGAAGGAGGAALRATK